MQVVRPVPQIVDVHFERAELSRARHHAVLERPSKKSGKMVSRWNFMRRGLRGLRADPTWISFSSGRISTQIAFTNGISILPPSISSSGGPPYSSNSRHLPDQRVPIPVAHFAADQVGMEIFARFELHPFGERNLHFGPAQLLRV